MNLVFATQNAGKLKELKDMVSSFAMKVVSAGDIGFTKEVIESGTTFYENAEIKARAVYSYAQTPCLADDSGLVVQELNGAPGIYSARFAGENATDEENTDKLLRELEDKKNRVAYFICVLAFIDHQGGCHFFEGRLNGNIANKKTGLHGFGYDPVFIPEGYSISLAEFSQHEKNAISHRFVAMKKFMQYLSDVYSVGGFKQ